MLNSIFRLFLPAVLVFTTSTGFCADVCREVWPDLAKAAQKGATSFQTPAIPKHLRYPIEKTRGATTAVEIEIGPEVKASRIKPEKLEEQIKNLLAKHVAKEFTFVVKNGESSPELRITSLSDGNFVITSVSMIRSGLETILARLNESKDFRPLLKAYFANRPNGLISAVESGTKLESSFAVRFSETSTPTKVDLDLPRAAGEIRPYALSFQDKHAFPVYEKALAETRASWDSRFPFSEWRAIGHETFFGTKFEKVEDLVGLEVVGISPQVKRVLSKPLDSAAIEEFKGRIVSFTDMRKSGPDPIWAVQIQTAAGEQKTYNFTEAVGVRVRKGPQLAKRHLQGGELEAAQARRQAARDAYRNQYKAPITPELRVSSKERNEKELAKLGAAEKKQIANLRAKVETLFKGEGGADVPAVPFLKVSRDDVTPRPLATFKDENFRPLVEELQAMLYDVEGPYGFRNWMNDFVTELAIVKAKNGSLRPGVRKVSVKDPHDNFPFAEGKHGVSSLEIDMKGFPAFSEVEMISIINRRIRQYGFDRGVQNVKDLKFAPESDVLGTLHGMSLEETTHFFTEYSRNNLLFQDTYFIGKPHGQYSHVFQWLYLAERLSQPKMNTFKANMIEPFAKIQAYFQDDFATGVRVTDHVGQRAPQNPDYVNVMIRLMFPAE